MADTMLPQPSSPLERLSQSSTLVDTTPSCPHPSALLSLTPELLLQIISHLPTTSYYSLTRTSHGLRLFFKIHAAHLCNTYIAHHFALEAHLLKSVVRDGWLVPTHQSVYTNLSSISLPKSEELLVLSEPGPHYLRFLQEYSKDILIRAEMTIRPSHPTYLQPPGLSLESDVAPVSSVATEAKVEPTEEDKFQAELDFTFMLSTYCVRPFTTRLNSTSPNPNRKVTTTRQVFGELPPLQVEKSGVSRLDDTHSALHWYFGAAGVANCPLDDGKRLGLAPKSGGEFGVWGRVRMLTRRRKEKISCRRFEMESMGFNRFKRGFKGLRIRALGISERMGYKLLAATKRSCLSHAFQSLDL